MDAQTGKSHWRLYAVPAHAAPPVVVHDYSGSELIAETEPIHAALASADYRGEPIVVALDSTWCLSASLTVDRPQELRDRRTMLYRLEESIPWSVEECVADYLRAGNKALAVAVPTTPLAQFFGRLDELCIHVQSIVPIAILACMRHLESGDWQVPHVVAFHENGWIDLFCVEANGPAAWLAFPTDGAALSQELKRFAVEWGAAAPLIGYGLEKAEIGELKNSGAANFVEAPPESDDTRTTLALASAANILDGKLDGFIELKHGAFGRTRGHVALRPYSIALQAAVFILLVSVIGVLSYRGHAAGREADFLVARQAAVFRNLFPNTTVPVGINNRLQSELAKLKGLQGDDSSLPNEVSATSILHYMLAAMPTDRRFRLMEIRMEQGRLDLDGEVIGHTDAEAIAQRLRAGFDVKSPRTQRLDDKQVSLRITATLEKPLKVATRKSP